MSLELAIYITSVLDNLHEFLFVLVAVGMISVFGGLIGFGFSKDEHNDELAETILKKFVIPSCLVTVLVLIPMKLFVPSSKAFAAMVVVPQIVESDLAQKGYEGLERLVDEWVDELAPLKKDKE